MARMTDDEFSKVLTSEIDSAASWAEESFSRDRIKAYTYYLGLPMGNEVANRSQVVSWDVFETIEAAMPDLVEIFCAGDNVAEFEPVGPEDEQYAAQATDYINYIVQKQNAGFMLFNTWIKDALLSKIGVVRAYWAEDTRVVTRSYTGLSDMQLTMLSQSFGDAEVEILENDSKPDPQDEAQRARMAAGLNAMAPEARMQAEQYLMQPPAMLHDLKLKITRKAGRVYIDNVQPENFVFSRRAKSLDAADLVGEFKAYTRSDLVERGFSKDKARRVTSYESVGSQDEGLADYADRDWSDSDDEESPDKSTEEVILFDGFIRCDYDGDGVAEWRKVLRGGNMTLTNEDADEQEFCVISPILIPHRLVGMSLADTVLSIQETNTVLNRQLLDALYLANNPRTYVNTEAGVNLNDLLDNRIGGIVRGKQPMQAALSPLQTSNPAPQALQGIEFMDAKRETRTGITRYNQGLDADSLNKTATGVSKIMSAGDRRKVLMARVMADTGIKALFSLILRTVVRNQDKAATVRLRNQWVEFDPTPWSADMDVTISVGLGTGDKSQLLGILQGILAMQMQAVQAGSVLADESKIYNTLAELVKASGLKSVDKFYNDPAKQEPKQPEPPQPTPEQTIAEAQVQSEQIKLQGKMAEIQANQAKAQMEQQYQIEKARIDLQIKQEELEIKRTELLIKQYDAQTRRDKVDADALRSDLQAINQMNKLEPTNGFQ